MNNFEAARRAWGVYCKYSLGSECYRTGYYATGVTLDPANILRPDCKMPENILTHSMKVVFLRFLLNEFFWKDILGLVTISDVMFLAIHDIGEVLSGKGDIMDDGSENHDEVAKEEEALISGFLRELTSSSQNTYLLESSNNAFHSKNASLNGQANRACDKLDAVLTQLYFEKTGIRGSMLLKGISLTEQDKRFIEITESDSPVDNWAAHLVELASYFDSIIRDAVYYVLLAAFVDVRGEAPEWLRKMLDSYHLC